MSMESDPISDYVSPTYHYFPEMSIESDLMVLISQVHFLLWKYYTKEREKKITSRIIQIISLFNTMDLDSEPKPESKFISLVKQIIFRSRSVTNSEPAWKFISQMTSIISLVSSDPKQESQPKLILLVTKLFNDFERLGLKDPKLKPLIDQIFEVARIGSLGSLISLSPELEVEFEKETEKFRVRGKVQRESEEKRDCDPKNMKILGLIGDVPTHFHCEDCNGVYHEKRDKWSLVKHPLHPKHSLQLVVTWYSEITRKCYCCDEDLKRLFYYCSACDFAMNIACVEKPPVLSIDYPKSIDIICNGEYHEECDKAPIEVKHPLHSKHSLQLVTTESYVTRKCYCCDEDLREIFYYCFACDYAMNIACVEKSPDFSIDYSKWHEHSLVLFKRHTSLTCDVCALTDSACPFYICPPCGFVVHHKCINLPRVIKISRHPHRISFTPSFGQGDCSCGVCRRKIDNDYGGFSCIKKDCSYAVHSRCATQSNVWDGKDLDGLPEEIEEEVPEPFVRISDGIIQHFSHPQHYLRLDEETDRDYNESKQCQACITPIYCGNIYSCTQCDFILHEKCANLSRKLYHPTHPHVLTLVGEYDGDIDYFKDECSPCGLLCTNGFFYECGKANCGRFKLHVQCATISEPLVHERHMHPLFLTSKPREYRNCGVCKLAWAETFNCIKECNFALCFECATLPHKVRYKHDKHLLTLTYGDETSTMEYWCEGCETKIDPKKQFYWCDDDCCVTLHIECLIGEDLYMKPNSSFFFEDKEFDVLPNSHHMSRPICPHCKKRCPHYVVFQYSGSITCSVSCTWQYHDLCNHKKNN